MNNKIDMSKIQKPTLQDLAIISAFKAKASSTIEDPEVAALFKIQALELQRMMDEIIAQMDPSYPTIGKYLPQLMANNYEKLALSAGQLKIEFENTTGLSTEDMDIQDIQEEMTTEVAEEINKNLPKDSAIYEFPKLENGQSFCDFAKEVLKAGSAKEPKELDADFIKLVKDSLEANIKTGNRFEAIKFLKSAFRDQHWTDIDCHRFINAFKESYEVVEPSKKPKKDKPFGPNVKSAIL